MDTPPQTPPPTPAPATPPAAPAPLPAPITFDDFSKIELRIATVLSCTAHPNADKLLVLQIDLGSEKRQICAGLRQHVTDPQSLVGKQIVVVANLAPRTMRGQVSQGMLLAATDTTTGKVIVVSPSEPAAAGSKVELMQRRTASNGVVYYASPLLEAIGVRHGFSTRLGGISPAPFDSLNLGNPSGSPIQDDRRRITENYRRLGAAIGCAADWPLHVHQVHGGNVVRVEPGSEFNVSACADAIVSDDPARAISVRIADCVPVLLSDQHGKTVAAIHAGWRGIIAGVIPQAITQMATQPNRLTAAIGPCIGPDAFEVGAEVLAEFERVFPDPPIRRRPDSKGDVDLRAAARMQLLAAGVPGERIDITDRCTFRDDSEFFSHRRQHGVTGRMAAPIAPNLTPT